MRPARPCRRVGFPVGFGPGFPRGFGRLPSGGSGPGYSIDGTSGKAVPNTLGEWQTFLTAFQAATGNVIAAPTSLRRWNETSGNLLDHIGSKPLTPNGASIGYNTAIAGWSRPGIAFTGVTAQRFADAAYADSTTTPLRTLSYVGYTGAPAASAQMQTYGSSDDASVTSGSGSQQTFRYRETANIVQMSNTYGGGLFPLTFFRDPVNNVARVFSDSERLAPTWGVSVGSTFSYGAQAGASAAVIYGYSAEWSGAGAVITEAAWKAMLQFAGFTITWVAV